MSYKTNIFYKVAEASLYNDLILDQISENDELITYINSLIDLNAHPEHIYKEALDDALRGYIVENELQSSKIYWRETLIEGYTVDKDILLFNNILNDEINGFKTYSFIDYLKIHFQNILDEVSESTHKITKDQKPLTTEEIDKWINLVRDGEKFTTLHLRNDIDQYKRVVYNAPTGSGKSLFLCKFIANSVNTDIGIVYTHSNESARSIVDQIVALNPEMDGKIKIFNSDQSDYEDIKKDPSLLMNYNWIICYKSRLLNGEVDVIFNLIANFKATVTTRHDVRMYIFSDECIDFNRYYYIDKNSIVNLNNALNNKLTEYVLNPNIETKYRLTSALMEFNEDIYSDIKFKDKKISEDRRLNFLSVIDKLSGSSKSTSPYIRLLNIRLVRLFISYLINNTDKFKEFYDSPLTETRFPVRIDDLIDDYSIAIFDATAELNYGRNNPFFKFIDIGSANKDICKFHKFDIQIPKRTASVSEYKEFFNKIQTGEIKFEDNSLILWYKDRGSNRILDGNKEIDIKASLKSALYKCGLKEFHIVHYNGTEIRGSNKFSKYKNIYILGQHVVPASAINDHRYATSNMEFTKWTRFVRECEQFIGRSGYRIYIHNPNSEETRDQINVYYTSDIEERCIDLLKRYYRTSDKVNLKNNLINYIDLLINDYKGRVGSKFKNIVRYIAQDIDKEYTLEELKVVGNYKSKLDTTDLIPLILFFDEYNIFIKIAPSLGKKFGSKFSDIYNSLKIKYKIED